MDAATIDTLLERVQWDTFWLPPIAEKVVHHDLIYLKSPLDLAFLNAVIRARLVRARLQPAVEEVVHAHREVRSRWIVPCTIDTGPLTEALGAAGYEPEVQHYGYAVACEDYRPRDGGRFTVRRVRTLEDLRLAHIIADGAFGTPRVRTSWEEQLDLIACTRPDDRVRRYIAFDEQDRPVSQGAMNLHPEDGLAYFWGGGTVPDAVGRGAYSALVAHRVAEAQAEGLSMVGLYARVDTSAPVVEAQGFVRGGRSDYWMRRKDPA